MNTVAILELWEKDKIVDVTVYQHYREAVRIAQVILPHHKKATEQTLANDTRKYILSAFTGTRVVNILERKVLPDKHIKSKSTVQKNTNSKRRIKLRKKK